MLIFDIDINLKDGEKYETYFKNFDEKRELNILLKFIF